MSNDDKTPGADDLGNEPRPGFDPDAAIETDPLATLPNENDPDAVPSGDDESTGRGEGVGTAKEVEGLSQSQIVWSRFIRHKGAMAGVVAIALIALSSDPARLAGMDRVAVAVTAIVVVLGWLAAEIWTFTRLRIPVFDPPPDDPR